MTDQRLPVTVPSGFLDRNAARMGGGGITFQPGVVLAAAVGVSVVTDPENLAVIAKPGCAAAIWRRQPLPEFQTWIDQLDPDRLPTARLILRSQTVPDAVSEIYAVSGTSTTIQQARLIDDIATLSGLFAALMKAPFLRLRLDRVTTNACHRFHIDAVTARLICTYRGTGTQYGISKDGTLPRGIFTVPTGAPIILRGTNWPELPASGLLHRSPPIEGKDETRLVLVIDPIFDPEDAA